MGNGYINVKVAAISMKARRWEKESNADKMEKLFREAAKTESQIAVITEDALEGLAGTAAFTDYNYFSNHPELVNRMVELAEPIDGKYINRFRELAKTLRMCLCFGFAERFDCKVYNTAIFIDYQGKVCGTYRKMHQQPDVGPLIWHGEKIRAFNTPYGRAGILICADRWNSLVARALVLDGAQVLYIPTHGDKTRKENNTRVMARARENGVPIVQANVGANLIISKGEIVGYQWGYDRVTAATIAIPTKPSEKAAKEVEREFLEWREKIFFKEWRKQIKKT